MNRTKMEKGPFLPVSSSWEKDSKKVKPPRNTLLNLRVNWSYLCPFTPQSGQEFG